MLVRIILWLDLHPVLLLSIKALFVHSIRAAISTWYQSSPTPRSGIGPPSTTRSETQRASCSIFQEDYDDEAELEDY